MDRQYPPSLAGVGGAPCDEQASVARAATFDPRGHRHAGVRIDQETVTDLLGSIDQLD
jgi:hypothetical protein